ncbi:MAG: exodeoxyribonuclease VII large subunit, partial [Candidatus Dadabacteria bacterium]|nr:exodeoxyribonuclease VII large subunit [Candidatus Dadabacteria bacterium]
MEEHPSFKELLKDKIYTVSEITARIKGTIEEEIGFEYVWIVGEISNFRGNYASGHWYFSLKDKDTQ